MPKLDQFYTKVSIAEDCLKIFADTINCFSEIPIERYTFLEPSAGSGAFLRALEKASFSWVASDLEPKYDGILRRDFLKDELVEIKDRKNILTIGNPPFGKKSSLALSFLEKSFDYSNTVGFILPIQFRKYFTQSKVRPEAKLILDERLPDNSFIADGRDYLVRCVFQIWTLEETSFNNIRKINKPKIKHSDFRIEQYNCTPEAEKYFNEDWDFAVLRQGWGEFTLITEGIKNLDRKRQWMFFKASDPKVLRNLKNINFEKLSERNTSVKGFGKADLIEFYEELYYSN